MARNEEIQVIINQQSLRPIYYSLNVCVHDLTLEYCLSIHGIEDGEKELLGSDGYIATAWTY